MIEITMYIWSALATIYIRFNALQKVHVLILLNVYIISHCSRCKMKLSTLVKCFCGQSRFTSPSMTIHTTDHVQCASEHILRNIEHSFVRFFVQIAQHQIGFVVEYWHKRLQDFQIETWIQQFPNWFPNSAGYRDIRENHDKRKRKKIRLLSETNTFF